jgi:ribonuclease HI
MELGALNIDLKPWTAIKSQSLVDFMAEWRENQVTAPASVLEHWVMYFDGSLKLRGGGTGVLFISPKRELLKYVFEILFKGSNNEAEYEALLHWLRLAVSLGIKQLLVYGDSLLVVQQVNNECDINKDTMDAYVMEIRKMENKFSVLEIHHVIRDNNVGADVLSKLGSDRADAPSGVLIHELHHPSIKKPDQSQGPPKPDQEVMMIEVDWRVPFIDFIKDKKLPPSINPKGAEVVGIMRRSKGYVLVGNKLYKHGSATEVLMKYVLIEEGKGILREIHNRACGTHVASRTLVGKAFRSGFYWPTALADAEELIHRCYNCQFFGKQAHILAHNLITIPSS